MKIDMKINNIKCANCALRIENEISKIEKIYDVSVSFPCQRLTIDVEDENFERLKPKILAAAKSIEPNCTINF